MLLIVVIAVGFSIICASTIPRVSASELTINSRNKRMDFSNHTILHHGIPQTDIFTNESSSYNYLLEDLEEGQVVYFSVTFNLIYQKSEFQVALFDYSGIDWNSILYEISGLEKYLGSWTVPSGSKDWILQVNDTIDTRSGNFSFTVLVSTPEGGYRDDTANIVNESVKQSNFTMNHEVHYWKVVMKENQIGTIFLKETTPRVLFDAEIGVYPQFSAPTPQPIPHEPRLDNPVVQLTEILGSHNLSWNAIATSTYFIIIKHNVGEDSPTGLYNISFSAEQSLYSFDTAGRLPYNKTVSIVVDQSYTKPKSYFFFFKVNLSRSRVNIQVYEPDSTTSTILDYALVKIYDEGRQDPIRSEREELQLYDGQINITLSLDEGYYYLVVTPRLNAGKGQFYIHFEYEFPQPFVWTIPAFLLNIGILFALPTYLVYLDSKGKWYRIHQWNIHSSLQDTYKLFRSSLSGIFNIKEVPNKSIMIRITNIPFKTFGMLDFIDSSEKETLVVSKRFHRKVEWFVYILAGLALYDIVNLLSFSFFSVHFLPIYIPNSTVLFIILAVPTALLLIFTIFVNLSTYFSYGQVINKISFIVKNYQNSPSKEFSLQSLDPEQASKNINYVRVLWNQAKHAFKEKNFELFVIKADASVKNLLSTRFQQLVTTPIFSKPDFQFQVGSLRKRGFDLPSEKKIAHFRNIRNRIVHSSITLDEKESVDCFAYYSAFISRLGLRST